MSERFDAIVVGTGQSGPPLAARLDQAGMRVAVIEREHFGGTCVNDGCIPTKTLVASARAAWVARTAADLGVRIGGPITVDMKAVKARKDEIVAESNKGVEGWMRGLPRGRVIDGHARFIGPRRLRVGELELEAERIFLNVGARAAVPPIPGLQAVPFLDNTRMMAVDFLPAHLIVLGGSYIALEFGQMYRRFGSAVTILERGPRLLSREDADIADAIRTILENEGVTVRTNARIARVEAGPVVTLEGGEAIAGSHLLVALGRVPNTDELGLAAAGVATDAHGYITVDDQLCTSAPGVWALGDCNGRGAFTHTSYNDYEIVAANLLDGGSRRLSDRIPASAIYVDPPLGRVGMSEREARASGKKVLVGRMPMTRVGRAREKGETQGLMKVLVDADSQQILGASLLGVGCDEVIHLILDVMYARAPYTVLTHAMHIHPTVAELIPTLLGDLQPL
jgi:pyruvate/2-oxoglutarate dehydrogenase complex dihydrolipoamide dehydrogenase (E3) component